MESVKDFGVGSDVTCKPSDCVELADAASEGDSVVSLFSGSNMFKRVSPVMFSDFERFRLTRGWVDSLDVVS